MNILRKQKYLLAHEAIFESLLTKKEFMLFLDYDGTLAPITETPDKAFMTQEMKDVLTGLSKLPRCHLAVISGRKLSNLKQMVDIPNIAYVGNHGFEIEDLNSLNFKGFITLQYKEALFSIKKDLMAQLSSISGIWIEDKGIILTIHYRLATDNAVKLARKVFMSVCRDYINNGYIGVMEGKRVLEIRPPIKWDKGEAVLWILSRWQNQLGKDKINAMYVGDDITDEDAFGMLEGIAITVKVGFPRKSLACYYLKNQQEVFILLNRILSIQK